MQLTGVPELIVTQDNEFFFTAASEGRLEIQRCLECETFRHPPAPCCAQCQSFEWEGVEVAPRGTVHSYTVAHRPQDSAFEYPHPIALVQIADGVRIVADVVETSLEELAVGLEVEVVFREHPHGHTLPSVRRVQGKGAVA